ncbi:LOG family protein [Kiloniella laminariae]|uniref:AMP nucleosidase n=1 Tax=Kiloniella laminariae TaxID=454162 RepID=A0ABT4LPB5_9PROT|nr:LOG family protein [Kiloniella laminariae]MCZ4282964.1 LOG family protein [Kiloniella laminariae]
MVISSSDIPKFYHDPDFMNSPDARALRILSEYFGPQTRFEEFNVDDTIVFFGSARIQSEETAQKAVAEAKRTGEGLEKAEKMMKMSRYYEETRELARRFTRWSKELGDEERRFVVCTGGGPGIMEAANRGASEEKGVNVGLNISLPFEQNENPYITRELALEFHYFFMRKFWFIYLAKAVLVMPGGFGTLDEFCELLTLIQTQKIRKKMPIVLYGSDYWNKVINFEALCEFGTISEEDLDLYLVTDSMDEAFDYVTKGLLKHALKAPGPSL